VTSIICNRKEKNIQQSAKPVQDSINLKKESNKKPQQNQSVGGSNEVIGAVVTLIPLAIGRRVSRGSANDKY